MPDPSGDSRAALNEAIEQVRAALNALREGVVTAVMRRNRLQDEVAKQEQRLADLDQKATLAERINNPRLAAELRAERAQRMTELAELKKALARAEAEAESAKIQMPEEEARLARQVNDLKAQSARLAGARVEASGLSGPGA